MMDDCVTVGIDFETSGHAADCACAIGLAKVRGGVLIDTYYSLIRPPNPDVKYTEIHGLTWDMLKDAAPFGMLWPRIRDFIDGAQWLVAHNAPFDRRVLYGCCAAAHVPLPQIPFACTYKGARCALPSTQSKKLSALCEHFHIPLQHHHAGSDAQATALIFYKLQDMGVTAERMQALVKQPRPVRQSPPRKRKQCRIARSL